MLKGVTRIGRFCNIAANAVLWNENHYPEMISTHKMFEGYYKWLDSFYEGIDLDEYKTWCSAMRKVERLKKKMR